MIRVVAVDDHPLVLMALETLISRHEDMQLVATANHGSKLMSLVRDHQPDIAIVDLGMSTGGFEPISSIKNLKEQFPKVEVLILTSYDDSRWVDELLGVGISGYMLKSDDFSLDIVQAIRDLYAGRRFFSRQITEKFLARGKAPIELTRREKSILLLMTEGKSTGTIADILGLSEKRIRNLTVGIYAKLKIGKDDETLRRIAVVNKVRNLGLLPGHDPDPNITNG